MMQFSSESLGGSDFSFYPCPLLSELDEEQLFGYPLVLGHKRVKDILFQFVPKIRSKV